MLGEVLDWMLGEVKEVRVGFMISNFRQWAVMDIGVDFSPILV